MEAQASGIDGALLAIRKAWFGTLFILSRESNSTSAAFVVTILSDLVQFSVFPILIAASLARASPGFQSAATALSVGILDIDTLFALADGEAGASAGRAALFWAALVTVTGFIGTLLYVMATLLSEGRQQAIVLKILGSMASVLTTIGFMPAMSLLLSIFRSCESVNALGVGCGSEAHTGLQILIVAVMVLFAGASTFFAAVYIDTDLTSSALGAKTTGRLDAAMLVAKLVLVIGFTTLSLDTVVQSIAVAAQALMWLCGVLFLQPYVQPMANTFAAAAAGLNLWMVMAVVVAQLSSPASMDALIAVGLFAGPVMGATVNMAYRNAVASSDFAQLRSALQADIWARARISLAARLNGGIDGQLDTSSTAPQPHQQPRGAAGPASAAPASDAAKARTRRHSATAPGRRMRRLPSAALHGMAAFGSSSGPWKGETHPHVHVHVLADAACGTSEEAAAALEAVSTRTLLPGVTSAELLRQAGVAYDEMLSMWPKSPVTYSSSSLFHRAYGSTVSSELTILALARKQVGTAWDVAFLSYQRTRQLQESSGTGLSAMDRILFEESWSAAVEQAVKCFGLQHKMWAHAAESNPDVSVMGQFAEDLYRTRMSAEKRFTAMLRINPESVMALRAYSRFCEELLGDQERATELANKAQRIETKHAKIHVRPLESVTIGATDSVLSVMDEHNAVITMTGELRRYGDITDANIATSRLFGRGRADMVGQSASSLFPEPLGSLYDQALLAYLSPHDRSEAFSRGTHVTVILTAGGWLAPARLLLQEGAGSELDATPCLSMVIQRAPSRRRLLLLGAEEEGFPVLHTDTESMLLLEEWERAWVEAEDEEDSVGDGGDDMGAMGTTAASRRRGGVMRRGWSGARGPAGEDGDRGPEQSMLRWLPGLPALAEGAATSSSGAMAELQVALPLLSGPVRRVSHVDDVVASGIVAGAQGGIFGRDKPMSGAEAGGVTKAFTMQPLHSQVLVGRRVRAPEQVTHWLLTWEEAKHPGRVAGASAVTEGLWQASRSRQSSMAVTAAASDATVRRQGQGRSAARSSVCSSCPDEGGRDANLGTGMGAAGTQDTASLASSQPRMRAQDRDMRGKTASHSSLEDQTRFRDEASSTSGVDGRLDSLAPADTKRYSPHAPPSSGIQMLAGPSNDGGTMPGHESRVHAPRGLGARSTFGDGVGSVASTSATARSMVKRVVETTLQTRDPAIRSMYAIIVIVIVAVLGCAVLVAAYLPGDQQTLKNLVLRSSLASRRAAHADVALGMWRRMLIVAAGFDEVDAWATLTSNLTTSVDKMEAAHRELISLSQAWTGRQAAFEEERSWLACLDSRAMGSCETKELLSASDLTELLVFHLRQIATMQEPADLAVFGSGNTTSTALATTPAVLAPALLLAAANMDLLMLALRRGERIAAEDLVMTANRQWLEQTVFAVTGVVVVFAIATLGTIYFAAGIGRKRFAVLSALTMIRSRVLRGLAKASESAQTSYARFIGADTGDDDLLVEGEDSPRSESRRFLINFTTSNGHARRSASDHAAAGATGRTPNGPGGAKAASGAVTRRVPMTPSLPSSRRAMAASTGMCCCRSRRPMWRKVRDTSCFVGKAALAVTSPLALIGAWISVLLVAVTALFSNVLTDNARAMLVFDYATGAALVRSRIDEAISTSGWHRVDALREARTNATVTLESLGQLLNGRPGTTAARELPALSATADELAASLFDVVVHDFCLVLPPSSFVQQQCVALQARYGLRGLHSLTTGMLDDGIAARAIFNASDAGDMRTIATLVESGALESIAPALRRYSAKFGTAQLVSEHLINMTVETTLARFDQTWGEIQLVLSTFSALFLLVVWLWLLPAVGRLEQTRRALDSVLLILPEDIMLAEAPIQTLIVDLANDAGMTQAARALRSMAKAAQERARPPVQLVRGSSVAEPRGFAGNQLRGLYAAHSEARSLNAGSVKPEMTTGDLQLGGELSPSHGASDQSPRHSSHLSDERREGTPKPQLELTELLRRDTSFAPQQPEQLAGLVS